MKNCKDVKSFSEEKFLPTFHDRKKYILHINCLIFYLNKGLILSKVHRIVSFEQKEFLKDYILSLTQLRSSYARRNLTFFCKCVQVASQFNLWKICKKPLNYTYAKLCLNKRNFKNTISKRFLRT